MSSRKKKSNTIMIVCAIVGVFVGVFVSRMPGLGNSPIFSGLMALVLLAVFGWAVWVIFSSFLKTKKAPKELEKLAKEFSVSTDKAVVYVFRDQFIAMLKALPIMINQQELAWIKGKTFARFELPEGEYTVSGHKMCKEPLVIQVKAGQVVFLEQEIVTGALKGSYTYNLLTDEQDAKNRIKWCKLVVSSDFK
ncbi:DUF2846 domain-containing protein [Neisseria sp. Ec49-e6-T10]|uniref:DUF2846 domain-containing protein n=1 Tax=Neisseria sp. Ec49-e6-T10 TaxID=3140744 RepID=UPI003EB9C244